MRFRLIDAEKARLPIDRMCALLGGQRQRLLRLGATRSEPAAIG